MILVTGADGYVGASIVQKLNNQKVKIAVDHEKTT